MIRRLLIANRGEIACRIIDTCRRLGVETVAVYSDADAGARHVEMADSALRIGGAMPAESYLDTGALLAAAEAGGAEAVHPGYGFLSENAAFAEAVIGAGLIWVGPAPQALRDMGLKDRAKALMARAGVPVVPGEAASDPDALARAAAQIGYPVLIKAVAGGGGKGMRRVEDPGGFAAALAEAQREAEAAFGNPDVLVEKLIAAPRHIEIQVFGDGLQAVSLFERDCSLQRRHQKVLEEAPAPGMSAEMRAAMGAAAVRAAEAIGYQGAGTVEFIVDASEGLRPDRFWFMEMNTRLQVEHPVTEAVTGTDLVAWQLRIAAGEPLPPGARDLALGGHAVEVRLYAEDPAAGFLPSVGRLAHLRLPEGVRVETGVREGDAVSPHYDPMIAKLVAHGETRGAALQRLAAALRQVEVAGLTTNRDFLAALVAHPDVVAGAVETGLIDRELAALTAHPAPGPQEVALAALAALDLLGPGTPEAGFALWGPLRWQVALEGPAGSVQAEVQVEGADRRVVTLGGAQVEALRDGSGWRLDGARAPGVCVHQGEVHVFGQQTHRFRVLDPLERSVAVESDADTVLSPMPGLVTALHVAPGAAVTEGAPLAVLEAMKMAHTLRAPRDGVVAEVWVETGAQVAAGAPLIGLAPRDEAAEA